MILNRTRYIISISLLYFSAHLMAQNILPDDVNMPILVKNSSFEGEQGASKVPESWQNCGKTTDESVVDVQPGSFGVRLVAFSGKSYIGMVGNDDGSVEAISQVLYAPLRAGRCYRLSLYLAKAEKYQTQAKLSTQLSFFDKPLKFVIWGATSDTCALEADNWLAETKPIHHNGWKKYVFYIQPPRDYPILVFQVGHVDGKVYNGNILVDNLSPIYPVDCSNLRVSSGTIAGNRSASLLINQFNEVIMVNGNYLKFETKRPNLVSDNVQENDTTEFKRNSYIDNITQLFEKYPNYKLIIRVKKAGKLTQKRVVYLYNYIFRNTNLKAQQVDIQRFKPKDEEFVWTFENDDIAISFDTI